MILRVGLIPNPLYLNQTSMKVIPAFLVIIAAGVLLESACKKEQVPEGTLQLIQIKAGDVVFKLQDTTENVPADSFITLEFGSALDTVSAKENILLKKDNSTVSTTSGFSADGKIITLKPVELLESRKYYTIRISGSLKGAAGETFQTMEFTFITVAGQLILRSITLNGQDFSSHVSLRNIDYKSVNIEVSFSHALDPASYKSYMSLAENPGISCSLSDNDTKVTITNNSALKYLWRYYFNISSALKSKNGLSFSGFSNAFYTGIDSTLKFPLVTDEELLTAIQQQTFRYFYDYAHPACGMARERSGSGDIVTTGGSGFGIMALIVGMERGFISRSEGTTRLGKIISYLETSDRFHGAWPHWSNGNTGAVIPFGTKDDGGDLVETAFMAQGLLTMRQYLNPADADENSLINRITTLYNGIEWDWYTRGGQNVLYWHWSPNYGWDMNFPIHGYNETLITYILAASSPVHTIPAAAYHQGFALNGGIKNGKTFYGYVLPVGYDYGGPLFFAHYSFLGLDPRNLSDAYAGYWIQNVNHSLINWAYCTDNPKNYPNYNAYCWGLTASDIPSGYGVSEPANDRGVIAPTAAVSSLPYSPEQSMNAIRFFYYILGDRLWGEYGFRDAFDVHSNWWAGSYIAIDQGPEICMIENYRSGLLWNLFMSCPEVQAGLLKLGFSY